MDDTLQTTSLNACSLMTIFLFLFQFAQKGAFGIYSLQVTLNVRGPSYLGLTRSISWLLMPWILTSPGHQQP